MSSGTSPSSASSWRCKPSTPVQADGLVKQFNAQRMQSQPRVSSAGSVFANPAGTFAGRLIEEAGLKQARVGGAEISRAARELHRQLRRRELQRDVYRVDASHPGRLSSSQTGIWLHPEIELLGRWSDEERQALLRAINNARRVQSVERDRVAHDQVVVGSPPRAPRRHASRGRARGARGKRARADVAKRLCGLGICPRAGDGAARGQPPGSCTIAHRPIAFEVRSVRVQGNVLLEPRRG